MEGFFAASAVYAAMHIQGVTIRHVHRAAM